MKNKRNKIVIGAGLVFAATALTGCNESDESAKVHTFENVEQCEVNRPLSFNGTSEDWNKTCADNFKATQEQHSKNAPKYNAESVCEADYKDCYAVKDSGGSDGGSVFIPFMAGYFISSIMNPSTGQYNYNNTGNYSAMYQSQNGSYISNSGAVRATSLNKSTTVKGSAVKALKAKPTNTQKVHTTAQKPVAAAKKAYSPKASVKSSRGFGASRTSTSSRGFGG